MNVTPEPLRWFDLVLACGLADVKAVSLQDLISRSASANGVLPTGLPGVRDVARGLLPRFEKVFGREVVQLKEGQGELGEMWGLVQRAEEDARRLNKEQGGWAVEPDLSRREI